MITKPGMSERTAAAIGRGIAEGRARALRGEVIGPWRGNLDDMREAVLHDDAAERERLAAVAHTAACRRWAELVLARAAASRRSALVLGDGDVVVGMRLADGTFAWPGDRVAWTCPITGTVDGSAWRVRDVWATGCLLQREQPAGMPMFGSQATRREVSEAGMARLMPWRWS